ncbi:4-alpha-glucanotransferase [Aurantiacibacter poecillastricola]|uniref:4-alpha-glucanotransferase n=1 Tax=Aurantiacibacter poecillastricola TaxID=3064385 RepID=UPI00273D4E31|nr:4-alpha-glucanotransferase [Aurantiacibacter sp. 219JJ12-13]MDP5261316.1 4-alpha-glucanotransferase [Aurantiacibacter sp. 219JJ12-13]
MSALHDLAQLAGLQVDWEDAAGQAQRVSDGNLRRILAALGYPADSPENIADSLSRARDDSERCEFVSARAGEPILLPAKLGSARAGELCLESGATTSLKITETAQGLQVPPIAEVGYHRLTGPDFGLQIAIAPVRCLGVADLSGKPKAWGAAVQLPSLRDGRKRAFGDFGALADTARRFAKAGAEALAISPTHALFPTDPSRYSPYAPSSRLFLNVLFADPELLGEHLSPGEEHELIDWEEAIPQRIAALRRTYEAHWPEVGNRVLAYRDRKGEPLERHAIYDALHAYFFAEGARGWQDWPEEFHDPASPAVARFADDHREEVNFHLFAQWLAAESLTAAQDAAREAGMSIGLIADLAVGMDGGGSHAWSAPNDLLSGLSVGAPPDRLGPDGQDWGLTTFSPAGLKRNGFTPFIETLRAALDHAGGIRIDHVLGLNRLWVVPHGGSAADGAYLAYPLADMLNILAIESHRANAVIIGEDLGTVPEGLRPKLEEAHVLGMRVLWFERDDDGDYIPPADWHEQAVAMTGTHDVTTIAGWWRGRDIDWAVKLGRLRAQADIAEARLAREKERSHFWDALAASGAANGPPPSPQDPGPVLDAALVHVGRSACELALVPLEDIFGQVEQPNIPGTIDEHPNWRRRMPATTANMLARLDIARRLEALDKSRW